MFSSEHITVSGLALAVIGIAISIYYGRRSLRQDKRELTWSTEAIQLLAQDAKSYRSVIRVTINEREVDNPYLIRLRIRNTGKLDLESSMFDQGRPLVFRLMGQKFYHVIEMGSPAIKATGDSIEVGPELLPSGESWIFSFLAEGPAEVHLAEKYLTNVKIRNVTPRNKEGSAASLASSAATRSVITASLSAIVAVIAALFSLLEILPY